MFKYIKSRVSPALIVATVAVTLAATGSAVATQAITGRDIKNNTVTSADIRNGSLSARDLKAGSITLGRLSKGTQALVRKAGTAGPKGDTGSQGQRGSDGATGAKGDTGAKGADGTPGGPPGPEGPAGPQGPVGADGQDGVFNVQSASLPVAKSIADIGGTINTRYTDLETGVTLPAGTYMVTVDAAFMSAVDAADPTVEVYPQVSLWIDRNGDDQFTWQDEGDISPNTVMPTAKDRHVTTGGTTILTLADETRVGLVAFGYTSTQGSERSGEIDVVRAAVNAVPVG